MKKYNVGDTVWVAFAEHRDVTEICPICFGKLKVMLILGNGDIVSLPCDYCGKGYNAPIGTVTETRYVSGAEQKTIESVECVQDATGESCEYRCGNFILRPERVFDTKEEALVCCEDIAKELNKKQETRAEYIKKDVKKTFSWNAGYHLREAKKKEESAAMHRKKAELASKFARDLKRETGMIKKDTEL